MEQWLLLGKQVVAWSPPEKIFVPSLVEGTTGACGFLNMDTWKFQSGICNVAQTHIFCATPAPTGKYKDYVNLRTESP